MLFQRGADPVRLPVVQRKTKVHGLWKLLVQPARHFVGPLDRLPSGIRLRTDEPPAQQKPEKHHVAQHSLKPWGPAFVSGDPRGLRATEQHLGGLPVDEIAGSEVKPVVTREGRQYVLQTPAADVLHRADDPSLPMASEIGDLPALVHTLVNP